jgi:hypothetical protein
VAARRVVAVVMRAVWVLLWVVAGCVPAPHVPDVALPKCTSFVDHELAVACFRARVAEPGGASFDEIVHWLTDGGWRRLEARGIAHEGERALAVAGKAAWPTLRRQAAEGRWDLARRRAAFVCAAWEGRGAFCPFAGMRAALEEEAAAYHEARAREVEEAWPAAARLHRCLARRDDCEPLTGDEARALRGHVEVEVIATPACAFVLDHPRWRDQRAWLFGEGGPTLARVRIVVDRCEIEPLRATKIPDVCAYPAQALPGEKSGRAKRDVELTAQVAEEPAETHLRQRAHRLGAEVVLERPLVIHRFHGRSGTDRWTRLEDGSQTTRIEARFEAYERTTLSPHCRAVQTYAPEALDDPEAMRSGGVASLASQLLWLGLLPNGADDYGVMADSAAQRGDFDQADHWALLSRPGRAALWTRAWHALAERHGLRDGFEAPRDSYGSRVFSPWAASSIGQVRNSATTPIFTR